MTLTAMRTADQAGQEALDELARSDFREVDPVLIDSKTEEFSAGWVYYYQSASYLQSGDPLDGLVGNAPLFVPRNGASPTFISYHRPTSESAEAFLSCGDANAQPNPEVELYAWKEGALKISATQAIREYSSLGLAAAKEAVDRCLAGASARVQTNTVAAARELVSKLEHMHFVARITYGLSNLRHL